MPTGQTGSRDFIFTNRMAENRSTLAVGTCRIETLETQLSRGTREITAEAVERFRTLLSKKLRDEDRTLRTA
jgi:hypothetical protein